MYFDLAGFHARREQWFALTRERIYEMVNPDGAGKLRQFDPPYREPIWILPALYSGSREYIDLANRMVVNVFDETKFNPDAPVEKSGKEFGIFQSNALAALLHSFEPLLTPPAREVMAWHCEQVFKTFKGSGQADFKFHGANDNMPMMASKGLILGGEALGHAAAVRQGHWNLQQFRRLLSRAAWASEFNSSTYTPGTLSSCAKIATSSRDPEIRQLALDIEHRLWAEVLLHYHPGTKLQAGPQSRAYQADYAGHNGNLQFFLWLVFGEDVIGRDMIASFFYPDGTEIVGFGGNYYQMIAGFTDLLDTELHIPAELAHFITDRGYPALLHGRSEAMGQYGGASGMYNTTTYMEEDFSLGTVDRPMGGGEQTASLYVTYKRRPEVKTFRDASTVFFKYLISDERHDTPDISEDGGFSNEQFIHNHGWCYSLQKDNVGLLLATPNLKNMPVETDTLKFSLVFPAHYGKISRSIIGAGPTLVGAQGESAEVVPVSVETGEVFIHVQPLLPTNLPRRAAVRFVQQKNYEILDFINYEGPARTFTRQEARGILNGVVLTVVSKGSYASLEAFHQAMSDSIITDYYLFDHRFFLFQRDDVAFEVLMTTDPFGVQTETIDGRHVTRPVFASNQLDVTKLPFMSGPVAPNFPLFPWGDSLEVCYYPWNSWLIGSR
ncbi:MAG TPA: hypothetical protein VGM23_06990, partial [Armatimonadota bacterium]